MCRVGIGILGQNGHQLAPELLEATCGKIVGTVAHEGFENVPQYQSYNEMLADPAVELVSICAPKRSEQFEAVLQALRNGKHVYAEKPCVMTESHLDEALWLAQNENLIFCEMANTMWEPPYALAKKLVESGCLGEIVQIFAQKSYPYAGWRPQNEEIDGGLVLQNALYGLRFILQIAGQGIQEPIFVEQTGLGNPQKGNLQMASSLQMRLANGGLAIVIANYLNQPATGCWGYEELRIFGTQALLKTNNKEKCVEVYQGEVRTGHKAQAEAGLLEMLLTSIEQKKPMPISMRELTMPTRLALRAVGRMRAEGI